MRNEYEDGEESFTLDPDAGFRGTGSPVPLSPEEEARLDSALALEKAHGGDESEEALTFRLFRENAPRVAMSVINVALKGSSERLRLDAGKYVLDRVLGKIGDERVRPDSPLDALVRQMQIDAEGAANADFQSRQDKT
jgi:hypothetical protein